MKLLAFSDSHASYQKHKEIVKYAQAQQASLLVCAGDFTNFSGFAVESLQVLSEAKLPLLLVPGNHDSKPGLLDDLCEQFPFVVMLDGRVKKVADVTFVGRGAVDWYRHYAFFEDPQGDKDNLDEICSHLDRHSHPLVLVSHIPPSGTLTATERGNSEGGSPMIRSWVERLAPDLVLCGHMHAVLEREDYIGTSWVVNVACTHRLFELGD